MPVKTFKILQKLNEEAEVWECFLNEYVPVNET